MSSSHIGNLLCILILIVNCRRILTGGQHANGQAFSPVPELSFLPAFSPYMGREERRVQGLD